MTIGIKENNFPLLSLSLFYFHNLYQVSLTRESCRVFLYSYLSRYYALSALQIRKGEKVGGRERIHGAPYMRDKIPRRPERKGYSRGTVELATTRVAGKGDRGGEEELFHSDKWRVREPSIRESRDLGWSPTP